MLSIEGARPKKKKGGEVENRLCRVLGETRRINHVEEGFKELKEEKDMQESNGNLRLETKKWD